MSDFLDSVSEDIDIICNDGESVSFYDNSASSATAINAWVNRAPVEISNFDSRFDDKEIQVTFSKEDITDVQTHKDYITLKVTQSDTSTQNCTITKIIAERKGFWVVRCRP